MRRDLNANMHATHKVTAREKVKIEKKRGEQTAKESSGRRDLLAFGITVDTERGSRNWRLSSELEKKTDSLLMKDAVQLIVQDRQCLTVRCAAVAGKDERRVCSKLDRRIERDLL